MVVRRTWSVLINSGKPFLFSVLTMLVCVICQFVNMEELMKSVCPLSSDYSPHKDSELSQQMLCGAYWLNFTKIRWFSSCQLKDE
jgi:hypothetical protein